MISGLVKLAVFCVVMYFVGGQLVRRIAEVRWSEIRFRPEFLLAAAAVRIVGSVMAVRSTYMLMKGLCRPPGFRTVLAVQWLTRIGRYVPGKLASVVGSVWLFRREGVPAHCGGPAS